jgi:aminopeptidase N
MSRLADRSGPEQAGVTLSRARERRHRIDGLRCDLHLVIPAKRTEPIAGTITLAFNLRPSPRPLVVDFAPAGERLRHTKVNGRAIAPAIENGHIVIDPGSLADGANHLTFDFIAGESSLTRRENLAYSLFVPARASHAFPCFDQPDLKARWRVSLDVAAEWRAVSNAHVADESIVDGWRHLTFARTKPLPTYLVAFAAGRFIVTDPTSDDLGLRIFHLEHDAGRIRENHAEIVRRHREAVDWLEDYTRIPYPFEKLDLVTIPAFQFTGMEHPGAIFYDADAILLDETAPLERHARRADVIAHETAHMWFGNLVTMPWFDDVWMKEVMAGFMAARITQRDDSADGAVQFFVQHYEPAYRLDRAHGALPVRQTLENLDEAGLVYGAGLYHKAPIALRHLERLVGEPVLRDAVSAWLSNHHFANAGWTELAAELSYRTSLDIAAWSQAWIESAGRPVLSVHQMTTDEGPRLVVTQRDERGRALIWPQDVDIVCGSAERIEHVSALLTTTETIVPTSANEWDWILPAGRCEAYGRVDLDGTSLNRLLDTSHAIADVRIRAAALQATWEALLEGRMDTQRAFAARLQALSLEAEEGLQRLLANQVSRLFWIWLPDQVRSASAVALESVVRSRLVRAVWPREKAAWFGLLQHVATQETTINWLGEVLEGSSVVDGLSIAGSDAIRLAAELAIRLPDQAARFMEAALSRCTTPDQRDHLEFIAPALSPDPSERERFVGTLHTAARTQPEAWIIDALGWIHHPLRTGWSVPLIVPALARLPDIRGTGSIFFPQRWASAVLAWHRSRAAAQVVADFIDSTPASYSPRLKAVILIAADDLLRVGAPA